MLEAWVTLHRLHDQGGVQCLPELGQRGNSGGDRRVHSKGSHGTRISDPVHPPDSPAEQAGLEEGDCIMSIDGVPVTASEQSSALTGQEAPGSR